MDKKGLLISIGRSAGYTVYGQSRGGKYPQLTIPKGWGLEAGDKVQFQKTELPGSVVLEEGDIVIRKIPARKET